MDALLAEYSNSSDGEQNQDSNDDLIGPSLPTQNYKRIDDGSSYKKQKLNTDFAVTITNYLNDDLKHEFSFSDLNQKINEQLQSIQPKSSNETFVEHGPYRGLFELTQIRL